MDPLGLLALVYKAVVFVYWGVAALCLYFAWSRPKSAKARALCLGIVVVFFGYLPVKWKINEWLAQQKRETAANHFRKRCAEQAGEKIYRVVENVEAIFLAKPRVEARDSELQDQFWMGDPYGYSGSEAMDPAGAFLYDRSGITVSETRFTPIKGYAYVEMPNPRYEQGSSAKPFLRYRLQWQDIYNEHIKTTERQFVPVAEPVSDLRSRYGVTWADISTIDDRKQWVAGGTLTVYDLRTKEVLGERIGYVFDPRLGSTSGGRQIWPNSRYCPRFENHLDRNKEFVAKVLKAAGVAHDK